MSLAGTLALSDSLTRLLRSKTRSERLQGGREKRKKKKKIYCIWGLWRRMPGRQKIDVFSYRGKSIKVIQRETLPGWLCPSPASHGHDVNQVQTQVRESFSACSWM